MFVRLVGQLLFRAAVDVVVVVVVIASDILKSQLPNLPFFKAPLTLLSPFAGDNSMTSHN